MGIAAGARAALVALAVGTTFAAAPGGAGAPTFVDVSTRAGLVHPTWCGRPDKPHILESGGTGLAWIDYDRDGDLDLYVVNAWRLQGAEIAERGSNLLYRNRGDGTFDEVGAAAGVDHDGFGTGVAVGDADGDGWPDLVVTNFGPDILYRNRRDGTFEAIPGAPSMDGWSTGVALFDADGDGDEDLFLAGYVESTLEEVLHAEPELDWEGMKVMFGPFGLEGLANRYFENLGGGAFREATGEAGLTDVGLYYSFAVGALDLDGDLDADLYVANDSNPNYVYENDGTGRFEEVGLWSGAALDAMGNAQAGMGLATGDLDDDGLPDLLLTNFYRDVSTLYLNLGDLVFTDVTRLRDLHDATFLPLSWGTTLADLDLDGDLDAFIANGHIYPQADRTGKAGVTFRQPNLLLLGEGERFAVAGAATAGPGLEVTESSRGLATADMDGDGDLDLAISNMDAAPTLLESAAAADGSGWLLVEAAGAVRAEAVQGERRWVRHRVRGGSYVSADAPALHFGLGPVHRVDALRLIWPDGRVTELRELPAGRRIVAPPARPSAPCGAEGGGEER